MNGPPDQRDVQWWVGAELLATAAIGASAIAVLDAADFVDSWLDRRAGAAFYRIPMEASEAEVIALMGRPDVEGPCGENMYWGDDYSFRGMDDGRCVREEHYSE